MQPAKKSSNEKCANISHQVNKLSRRLEALASAVNQLNHFKSINLNWQSHRNSTSEKV